MVLIKTAINMIKSQRYHNCHENITKSYATQSRMILFKHIKDGVEIFENKQNGKKYVGKTMKIKNNEKNIMDICKDCPYIIGNCFTKTINNTPHLMMPFHEYGDLHEICLKGLAPSQIRKVCQQVLHALHFMHERSILHRDIKAGNIILTNNEYYFDIKVIDFGISVMYNPNSPPCDQAGTLNYSSPEVLYRQAQSPKSDIWSFGVMIYTITTLSFPFKLQKVADINTKFDVSSINYKHKQFQNNPVLVDFLKSIFKLNPQERPSAEILLKHPWVR